MKPIFPKETCLLVVDAQCGFTSLCPDELPAPGGLEIVPFINQLLKQPWARIDASQDWHPPDHRSFFGQKDNLYPPHCVAGTKGAEFLPGLNSGRFHTVWRKGYDRDVEAYAITAQQPAYGELLRKSGITTVVVCGLARNICCFFAARDLRQAGFRVVMAEDASAGIDVPAAKLFKAQAKKEGQAMGIDYVTTGEILRSIISE
jgi:nicotinamidase/pyrazinamidase